VDKVVVLDAGKVIGMGPTESFLKGPGKGVQPAAPAKESTDVKVA